MSSPVGAWGDVPCENRDAAPSSRELSACAVYKDCLYVFGGQHGTMRLNDFYEFSFPRRRWRVVPPAGFAPSPREGHTCVLYKDALYVFGGRNVFLYVNDLIEYSFLTQQWRTVVANVGFVPTARALHSAVVHNKSMYCFGGYANTGALLGDFHQFNFETLSWSAVQAAGKAPSARYCASFVALQNTGILFGGYGSVALNDLYTFDFNQRVWAKIAPAGSAPAARSGHIAVTYADAVYIFGGIATAAMNDLHEATPERSGRVNWRKVPMDGAPPQSCYYHTAAVYDSSLIVFGGRENGNNLTQFRFEESKHTRVIPDNSLVAHLRGLVNNELTSDLKFVVEGTPIYAHKYLCMRCDHFKAMFTSEMLESRTHEVVISDVRPPVFISFLEYLYTDDVDTAVEHTMELLVVADRYGVDRLKRICEDRILVSLGVDNAATLLYEADLHNATVLRGECVSFMLNNFDAVSKTPAFDEMSRKNVELNLELLKLR